MTCESHQQMLDEPRINGSITDLLLYLEQCTMLEEQFLLPVIIILGTVGNSICIVIYQRKRFRGYSVSFYLTVYSIINTLSLYVVYGTSWITSVSQFPEITNLSDWGCRIWQFVTRIIMHSGIWIMVATTFDRYISVCHQCKATTFSTVFMAKIAVILVGISFTVVSIHAMWTYELVEGMCVPLNHSLHYIIWNWFYATFSTFIPLMLLIVLNVLIICGLCHKDRHSTQKGVPADLTNTVLAMSITFVLIALPATIINIIYYNLSKNDFTDDNYMIEFSLAMHIANFITCGNPSIGCTVCLLFSPYFRSEFKVTLCKLFIFRRNDVASEMKIATGLKDIRIEEEPHSHETLL